MNLTADIQGHSGSKEISYQWEWDCDLPQWPTLRSWTVSVWLRSDSGWRANIGKAWKKIILGQHVVKNSRTKAETQLYITSQLMSWSHLCFRGPSITSWSEFLLVCRVKLCCYLLSGKWTAEQTNCQDGFASQGEININVLLKRMLSQHNACQNCLFLMKSSICLWVALQITNYFFLFEMPDSLNYSSSWFDACHWKCVGWLKGLST